MLSAFIICFNEEETIKRAIDSLYFADEIIVVDSERFADNIGHADTHALLSLDIAADIGGHHEGR